MKRPDFIPLALGLLFLLVTGLSACESTTDPSASTGPSAPATVTPMATHPVFTLDEAHNALWQDSARPFLAFPADRLSLRQDDYTFHIPSKLNSPAMLQQFGQTGPVRGPNVVHVLYRDNLYRVPWMPVDGTVQLEAAALGGGQKNKPIARFEPRNTVYILIGFEGPAAEPGADLPFAPFYAMRILLDENPMRFVRQSGTARPLQ